MLFLSSFSYIVNVSQDPHICWYRIFSIFSRSADDVDALHGFRMEVKDFLANPILEWKVQLESQVEMQHQPVPDHRQQQKSVFEKYVPPNSAHISQLKWEFITVYSVHKKAERRINQY